VPYLGHLARWVETLKRPKRALIVDIPIELDDGASRTSRASACSTT
jgi:glutamate dehydrogenase (NAD(P)+)